MPQPRKKGAKMKEWEESPPRPLSSSSGSEEEGGQKEDASGGDVWAAEGGQQSPEDTREESPEEEEEEELEITPAVDPGDPDTEMAGVGVRRQEEWPLFYEEWVPEVARQVCRGELEGPPEEARISHPNTGSIYVCEAACVSQVCIM